MDDTEPYDSTPATPGRIREDALTPEPHRRSFSSMDGFLVLCSMPPLMGFSFVAFGFYTIYRHTPLVISHSTEHAAKISQAFTAICAVWHFIALIPVISVVQKVRSEEWWRRLSTGNSFKRANSVSSNINGTFAHTVEVVIASSSRYFKFAWMLSLIAVILADIAPAAIHTKVGLNSIPTSFLVPALPPNSIYSNYSEPFFTIGDQVYSSVDIAGVYYNALLFTATDVKAAPPTPNALVPQPNISPGQGYRYLTDVYVHFSQAI
jgi:hypothetical protein